MNNYRIERVGNLFRILCLLFLVVLFPLIIYGESSKTQNEEGLALINNRVTAHIRDASLSDTLKDFEKATGIEMIIDPNLAGRKTTAFIEDIDSESAIRQIVDENNLFAVLSFPLNPKSPGLKQLKQIRVSGESVGAVHSSRTMISIDIPYGSGEGEVGAVTGTEGSSMGPMSFTVDSKGDIYISDTVNARIQVFSPDGKFKTTVPLKERTIPADIAVDEKGFIYVYDRFVRKLYQYELTGILKDTVAVDSTRWQVPIEMYLVRNDIIMNACSDTSCGDVIIGRISKKNSLLPPSKAIRKGLTREANIGMSGRQYKTREIGRGRALIEITEGNGDTSQLSLPISGLDSAKVLGEDKDGNYYIKTVIEGQDHTGHTKIQKFSKHNDYVDSTLVPSRASEFWSANDIHVSKNGDFYMFTPEADKLIVDIIMFK